MESPAFSMLRLAALPVTLKPCEDVLAFAEWHLPLFEVGSATGEKIVRGFFKSHVHLGAVILPSGNQFITR